MKKQLAIFGFRKLAKRSWGRKLLWRVGKQVAASKVVALVPRRKGHGAAVPRYLLFPLAPLVIVPSLLYLKNRRAHAAT